MGEEAGGNQRRRWKGYGVKGMTWGINTKQERQNVGEDDAGDEAATDSRRVVRATVFGVHGPRNNVLGALHLGGDRYRRLVWIGSQVMGQILPGVPVWSMPEGSRWPGLPLVVFPGNVGGKEAMVEAMLKVR